MNDMKYDSCKPLVFLYSHDVLTTTGQISVEMSAYKELLK